MEIDDASKMLPKNQSLLVFWVRNSCLYHNLAMRLLRLHNFSARYEKQNGALVIALLILTFVPGHAWAFAVMPSLNTYNKELAKDALIQVAELKCDGVWFITQNSDFEDSEWRFVFDALKGHQVSEDNPNRDKSYVDYLRIMKKAPDASLCYNETGGLPGGTLLTDEQIQRQYESHGNRPIICLTRSYGGEWKTRTDRCLISPKVGAICMECVKEALLENINDPAGCIKAARRQHKRVYILLHAAGDGWSLEENRKIITNLNNWCPREMADGEVFLVYQNYHGGITAWFGPGGVKEAIQQACRMPNYSAGTKAIGK